MGTVMDLPNVPAVLFTKKRRHIPRITGYPVLRPWIFIRNILFIPPLGAEWVEWRPVHSGIGMWNRKTRAFHILSILIPEF